HWWETLLVSGSHGAAGVRGGVAGVSQGGGWGGAGSPGLAVAAAARALRGGGGRGPLPLGHSTRIRAGAEPGRAGAGGAAPARWRAAPGPIRRRRPRSPPTMLSWRSCKAWPELVRRHVQWARLLDVLDQLPSALQRAV